MMDDTGGAVCLADFAESLKKLSLTPDQNIAIALSGGGDSMALLALLSDWLNTHQPGATLHALSVNHNLRPDSEEELLRVREWVLPFKNVRHDILTWAHDKTPKSKIMEQAREARYSLMADYCTQNNISQLFVAHHGDDQMETLLFRLAKGSGLNGLCGIRAKHPYSESLTIYRPLLDFSHAQLLGTCKAYGLSWLEDPSNHNKAYARPRLRKALEDEGYTAKRATQTAIRLQRAQEALDDIAEKAYTTCASQKDVHLVLDVERLNTWPEEIRLRVLLKAIEEKTSLEKPYPPNLEKAEELLAELEASDTTKRKTIFGVMITKKNGDILIEPENAG